MSLLLLALGVFPSQLLPYDTRPEPGLDINTSFSSECPSWVRGFDCAVRMFNRNDSKSGVRQMTDAARSGDTRAMRALGLMLVRGEYVRQDQEAALGWFYEAALRDDRESMTILSTAFDKGIGTAPDPDLASYWRARASRTR